MTSQFLSTLKPVHTQFTLYDFPRGWYDWLGQLFLNRELELIDSKSFFLFINIDLNNDYLLFTCTCLEVFFLGFP